MIPRISNSGRYRRHAALLITAVALAPLAVQARAFDGGERRPNVIFLLTDDHRVDHLGCYGNETLRTPHLDQLAADGVLFENAFVTSAICTPSRASYFLGQYERRHGVNFNSGTAVTEAAWQQSYPMLLRNAGYFTGYVGKNHVPIGPAGYDSGIIEQSFDYWYAAHQHLTFYPKERHRIFELATADTQVEILQEGALHFLDSRKEFLEGTVAFLQQRPVEKPFCLTICFNLPHAAGTSSMRQLPSDPELYRTAYREYLHDLPLPDTYIARNDIQRLKLPRDVHYAQFRQPSYDYVDTPEQLRERMVREFQTVTGIDQLWGEVREQLEALELADSTVVIFASDHGVMHGEHGLGGKALNYDPCLRIPMIIMDPRIEKPPAVRRETRPVMSIDVMATLLELAGVEVPDSVQGRSLVPLIRGAATDWRKYAFAENLWSTRFGNPRCESVHSGEWKYIRYFANDRSLFEGPRKGAKNGVAPLHAEAYRRWLDSSILGEQPDYEELFHVAEDPGERVNLATSDEHAERLRHLRSELDRMVREARGDPQQPPQTVPLGGE